MNMMQARSISHVTNPRTLQQGVVLLIALVLLVVIGFSSAFILRGTLFNNLISSNNATSQAANHAAEVALSYCEELVRVPGSTPPFIFPEPDSAGVNVVAWQTESNWSNANTVQVPASVLQSGSFANTTSLRYERLPRCLIERLPINRNLDPSGTRNFGFQITARGFSPEYRRAANGNIISGSEVILQSVLRLSSCEAALAQPDCP
jgi:Tfp pilus assembly protein PilX